MSLPSRFSVLVEGSSAPGHGRVRDLLDADDDVHGVVVLRRSPTGHKSEPQAHCDTAGGLFCGCF